MAIAAVGRFGSCAKPGAPVGDVRLEANKIAEMDVRARARAIRSANARAEFFCCFFIFNAWVEDGHKCAATCVGAQQAPHDCFRRVCLGVEPSEGSAMKLQGRASVNKKNQNSSGSRQTKFVGKK
jgi:hypothetical protein